ncbi:MAG: hypothetical protein E6G97_09995 [Alphaproteobacteria bacterium]|nr:MAG: hypothetical protein E6G97_09995 [Alphaproteobacteria bacterium]
MNRLALFGAALLAFALLGGAVLAQPATLAIPCGATGTPPVVKPIIKGEVFIRDDPNFDCHLWQTFIYLNWPAKPGARGVPEPKAKFGAPGTTVWETYPTVDQTFLSDAKDPGPWNQPRDVSAAVPQSFAARVANGSLRALSRESKISREVIENVVSTDADPDVLHSITQAFGGVLYDQNRKPVYYEIAMNEDQYTYIRDNGLYDADTQLAFANKQTIALPAGDEGQGKPGAIELKAAWKILGPKDDMSRFHTAQAIVINSWAQPQPITVGLVGLHIVQTLRNTDQAVWGTFAHIDNAPLVNEVHKGRYNFYNPDCPRCAPNNEKTNPTQVVQMNHDGAGDQNQAVMKLIIANNPKSVWQYYKLINAQWPKGPVALSSLKVPAMRPLPLGDPSLGTLMNPVLETFMQRPKTNCLQCHSIARISHRQSATNTGMEWPRNASGYSFMFSYADSKPKQ